MTYKVTMKNYRGEILRTDLVEEKNLIAFFRSFAKDATKIAHDGISFEVKPCFTVA